MGTVVGSWRLKLILILVIFSSLMYLANALFGNLAEGNVNEEGYIVYNVDNATEINYNESDLGVKNSNSFVDVLLGFGNFLTFSSVTNPWARLLLSSIMGVVLITIGYLIFTFVKEWIPLV